MENLLQQALDKAGLIRYTAKLKRALAGKQDTLSGSMGQVVGFGEDGKAEAQSTDSLVGPAGKDGVSVTHQWSGSTLTVTSASGTSSADLRGPKGADGANGKDGAAGAKGETGATGATGPKGDPGLFYGTCSTAANTAAKEVVCSGFTLRTGAVVAVKFTNANGAANPTLNVNGSGAKPIYYAAGKVGRVGIWETGEIVEFIYDGTNWYMVNPSFAEGVNPTASGEFSHAEGAHSTASGNRSHAEGDSNTASGEGSHAEGRLSTASGDSSHAEGYNNTASSEYSHAEGYKTKASSNGAHAEGSSTIASGSSSHAEGYQTTASGGNAHAEGYGSTAKGMCSHAAGSSTIANDYQFVVGTDNVEKAADGRYGDRFIVGGGWGVRKNAFRVNYTGACYGSGGWNTSGADYAELFEWADGNPDRQDRVAALSPWRGRSCAWPRRRTASSWASSPAAPPWWGTSTTTSGRACS